MVNRAFFDTYYAALTAADFSALERCYEPDIALTSMGETIRGRDALLSRIRDARKLVYNEVIPEDVLIDGDRAAVVFIDRFKALTDDLKFLGHHLSAGEQFEMRICGFYHFLNGRIKAVEMFNAQV